MHLEINLPGVLDLQSPSYLAVINPMSTAKSESIAQLNAMRRITAKLGRSPLSNAAKPIAPPAESPYKRKIEQNADALLERAVRESVFPGAVLSVAVGGRTIYSKAFGTKWDTRFTEQCASAGPMDIDTVFDVAGLTQAIVTLPLLMKFVGEHKVNLSDRLSRYIQGFGVLGKSPITIAQLLSHTSGLPAWTPFYEDLLLANSGTRMGILTSRAARDFIITSINRSALKSPPGTKQLASETGFLVLGHLVEILSGMTLEKAAQRYIFHALGLKSTSYIDLSLMKRRGIHPVTNLIAPTEECPWRNRVLCGEVHDDNTWAMGGIAGHSGLFTTAADVQAVAMHLLMSARGESDFLKPQVVQQFWSYRAELSDSRSAESGWHLGWESPSSENGLDGSALSPQAVGICGFTGCSLWMEPARAISIVLLSNRVHPSRGNKKIRAFRAELHSSVLAALGS